MLQKTGHGGCTCNPGTQDTKARSSEVGQGRVTEEVRSHYQWIMTLRGPSAGRQEDVGRRASLGPRAGCGARTSQTPVVFIVPFTDVGLHLTFLDLAVGIELACPHLPGGSHPFLRGDFLEPSLLPIPDVCHCECDVTNLQGRARAFLTPLSLGFRIQVAGRL